MSKTQRDKVLSYIASAKEEGARLVTGGKAPETEATKGGYFVLPTIFADVKPTMRIAKEEIFGPVQAVFRWTDEEEMWKVVNGTEYGLTGSIWTRDLATAQRAAKRVQAGYVWIVRRLRFPTHRHRQRLTLCRTVRSASFLLSAMLTSPQRSRVTTSTSRLEASKVCVRGFLSILAPAKIRTEWLRSRRVPRRAAGDDSGQKCQCPILVSAALHASS